MHSINVDGVFRQLYIKIIVSQSSLTLCWCSNEEEEKNCKMLSIQNFYSQNVEKRATRECNETTNISSWHSRNYAKLIKMEYLKCIYKNEKVKREIIYKTTTKIAIIHLKGTHHSSATILYIYFTVSRWYSKTKTTMPLGNFVNISTFS